MGSPPAPPSGQDAHRARGSHQAGYQEPRGEHGPSRPDAHRPAHPPERLGRHGFTGRAALLALTGCVLIMLLAYPLRQYLGSRSELAGLETTVAGQEAKVAELKAEQQRWKDPAYVKAQARTRLHYAMPGETPYIVLEPTRAAGLRSGPAPSAAAAPAGPWYSLLWRSVQAADAEPREPVAPMPSAVPGPAATGIPVPVDGTGTR